MTRGDEDSPGARSRRRPARVIGVALATAALTLGSLLVGGTAMGQNLAAPAPTQAPPRAPICDKFGSAPLAGATYVAQNNVWGAETRQCITPTDAGFTVSTAAHTNNAGPASYPSIYRGCVYGYCTPNSVFPLQVSSIGQLRSTFTTTGPTAGGTQQYNTAYDLWFDPNRGQAGRNTGLEMMIWLNRTSWVQPIGRPYYDVNIGGALYTVWYGTIDLPVISYVRKTPVRSVSNLPLELFVRDAQRRGVLKPEWWLTSAQAGFEPWTGGQGLVVSNFTVTHNGR